MVHRIQNRNPGYSDFSVTGSAQSFNFSPTVSSPIINGANALKLENEVITEPTITASSERMNEQKAINNGVESVVKNNHTYDYEKSSTEEVQGNMNEAEENTYVEEAHVSNGLENFGVEGETSPDLFTSDNETTETESLLSTENTENNYEDDDLEIPAFLRRQKN